MRRPQDWPHPWPTDHVVLTPINAPAIVEEISVGRHGVSVRVSFWVDGRRMDEWVNPSELKPAQ